MTITAFIVVFTIVWWLVLFTLLPLGVEQEEAPEAGHDRGAPKRPHIGRKLWAATLIALVLTTAYVLLLSYGYLDFIHLRN